MRRTLAAWLLLAVAACGGGSGGSGGDSPGANSPALASATSAALQVAPLVWPRDVFAEVAGVISLSAYGGDGKATWSVECGTGLDCDVVDGRLRLVSTADAGPARVAVTLKVSDGLGARASTTQSITAWPKAITQGMRSLAGAADRPGLHLLILGDGFSQEELHAFHTVAANFMDQFFSHPEIAAHRGAWNVHVADLVTHVDPVSKVRAPSPLGARLGCQNIPRLLCVETGRAQKIASLFLPHYTQVLVISNHAEYGGSGGLVASITRHPTAVPAAVHELGHSFAGLGDEYVEENAVSAFFFEGLYPNVTATTDRGQVPWSHWIEARTAVPTLMAPALGADIVGLYEGALLVHQGRFRPTFDSLMRSIGSPMGPVNGEAWARRVYARGGAWAQVAPATDAVLPRSAQPAGGWLFKAQPLLDGSIAQTRWYVDGVERTPQRGANQLLVPAAGALQVRVDLVDLTGRVRQDQGLVSSLNWGVP